MNTHLCEICCNEKPKYIDCEKCKFRVCDGCCKKYILLSTIEPHCMKCRNTWERSFLSNNFTISFVNKTLKNHRENILFDIESSMIPATQMYAEQYVKGEKLFPEIHKINTEISDLLDKKKKLIELQKKLFNGEEGNNIHNTSYVCKCPKISCLGYICNTSKCTICSCKICLNCHEIIDIESHECNPDIVKSIQLIKQESKPCPNCGTLCFKVDGCDQVFARCCATTFSWKTGKIETGTIHAPDYYTWLQQHGKNINRHPLDIPCGGVVSINILKNHLKTITPNIHNDIIRDICTRQRLLQHIQNIELPKYFDENIQLDEINRKERVQYIIGRITKQRFKSIIQQKDKLKMKRKDILTILNTVVIMGSDILNNIVTTINSIYIIDTLSEFNNLQEYMNSLMKNISKIYNCVTPRIPITWDRIIMTKY